MQFTRKFIIIHLPPFTRQSKNSRTCFYNLDFQTSVNIGYYMMSDIKGVSLKIFYCLHKYIYNKIYLYLQNNKQFSDFHLKTLSSSIKERRLVFKNAIKYIKSSKHMIVMLFLD